jgi:hypothetical protein
MTAATKTAYGTQEKARHEIAPCAIPVLPQYISEIVDTKVVIKLTPHPSATICSISHQSILLNPFSKLRAHLVGELDLGHPVVNIRNQNVGHNLFKVIGFYLIDVGHGG